MEGHSQDYQNEIDRGAAGGEDYGAGSDTGHDVTLSPRKRDRIVATARDLLRQQGLAGMSMEGVARRAGVSRQTVYNQFADRVALLKSCCDSLLAELSQQCGEPIDPDLPPEVALGRAARDIVRLFGDPRHLELIDVVLRGGTMMPWLAGAYERQIMLPITTAIENYLLHRQIRGEFRGLDPRDGAQVIVAIADALAFRPRLLGLAHRSVEEDEQRVVRTTLSFVASNARGRKGEPQRARPRAGNDHDAALASAG